MTATANTTRPTTETPRDCDRWTILASRDGIVVLTHASALRIEPEDHVARLVASLALFPGPCVVGARRVDADGRIFSVGEFVLHPKGFHHEGRGVDGTAYRFPHEVDAICGGVIAMTKADFERCGGVERLREPLGMLELCLEMRAGGGGCVVVPDVQTHDEYTPLSDVELAEADHRGFRDRWGFNWRAADLDEVARRHAGSGLLWNVRFFGSPMPFEKYDTRPALHWKSYEEVGVYRERADHLVRLVRQAADQHDGLVRIVDVGCGDGLFTHLFAGGGVEAIGVDPEPQAIAQARTAVGRLAARGVYDGPMPVFHTGLGQALPVADGEAHVVAMLDVIEHLPNPVAVLREVERVLIPGGHVVISTPAWQYGSWSDSIYHVTEYTEDELVAQIQHATSLTVTQTGRIGGTYRDVIAVGEKPVG